MAVKEYKVTTTGIGKPNWFTVWENSRRDATQEAFTILKCLYRELTFEIEKTTRTIISIVGKDAAGKSVVHALVTSMEEESE